MLGSPDQLEPIQHSGRPRFGIPGGAMRPETFAGNDVFATITVHVHQIDGMQLGELDPVLVLFGFLVHENIFLEPNLPIGAAFLQLLVPSESVAWTGDAGDDIV